MKTSLPLGLIVVAAFLPFNLGVVSSQLAYADVKCVRATNKISGGKVVTSLSTVTRSSACKKGEVKALSGPKGLTGAMGADGQLRVFGDGSDGSKSVSMNQTLSDPAPMYSDVVIESGMTWTVPSGTVIRCTGRFENNGTIAVQTGAPGGQVTGTDVSSLSLVSSPPHPGVSARAPSSGEFGDGNNTRSGGRPGYGLSLFQASSLRYPGPFAGGGGAGGAVEGGRGGGSLVVLCKGEITNSGLIRANGENGSMGAGGGAGGVIILASKTSVVSVAGSTIQANGGDGGSSGTSTGPSGGGGGGIVLMFSPEINTTGATVTVTEGAAGADSGISITGTPRSGGHGGGACGGSGGVGGSVIGTSVSFGAFPGSEGHIVTTLKDPTSLF